MNSANCRRCGSAFIIADSDLSFYEKVSPVLGGTLFLVPPPTLCYSCRQRRKLSWRNERTLYYRACDLTGRRIMSTYAPDSPLQVYNCEDWFSDRWEALRYGRDFDFSRPFFEQFAQLMSEVPVPALFTDSTSENTGYANLSKRNKNSYFIFAANDNEDCLYTTYLQRSRSVCDCFFIFDSELCYECIDCYNCFNTKYSQYCKSCSDSSFLLNCIGCSQCFCCASLRNKRYCIFNQPVGKDSYEAELLRLLERPDAVKHYYDRLAQMSRCTPQKYYAGVSNSNISGDHISFSKNAFYCFDCTYLEDCKYCTWLHRCKDCYDHYAWGLPGELGYENHLVGDHFYNVRFSEECFTGVSDLLYCRGCINNCAHLFGCIGLQHKKHCILNKQYTPEAYEQLAARIIEHMRSTEEWGEFFPTRISPYGYNETVAQEYFPLADDEVLARGWKLRCELPFTTGKETLSWSRLTPAAAAAHADLTREVLACMQCGRNYRITTEELKFYRKEAIPVPVHCFSCRYAARRARRNPRRLQPGRCAACGKQFLTSFEAASNSQLLCEECYTSEG